MASVALDKFLPEVMPEAPGVPYPVAINAVRNACFDFCKRSLFWNETAEPEPFVAGEPEYVLTPPTGAQVVSVLSVVIDEKTTVYPAPLEVVVAARPAWQTATGLIEAFIQPASDTIRFVAVPDTSGAFSATVAYAPSRDSSTVDKRVYDQYLECIKHGALWKLKMMSGQTWSDPASAQYYEKLFNDGIGEAVIERNRSNSRAALRVVPRAFA